MWVALTSTTTLSGGVVPATRTTDVTAVPSVPVATVSATWLLVASTTLGGVMSGSGEVIAYTTAWVGTGPGGLKLERTVVNVGTVGVLMEVVKIESPR